MARWMDFRINLRSRRWLLRRKAFLLYVRFSNSVERPLFRLWRMRRHHAWHFGLWLWHARLPFPKL